MKELWSRRRPARKGPGLPAPGLVNLFHLAERLAVLGLLAWTMRATAAPMDYLLDVWGTENDLPGSTVTDIAQTPDGYLWVGTYDGLAKFDGAAFVTFDAGNRPALSQTRVQGLFLDANGTLWINTFRGGLTSLRNGVFRNEWPDQPTFNLHTSLVASSSNLVTFVTQFGEVLQRDPARTNLAWKIFPPPDEMRPIYQCADREGRLWFLTRDGRILRFAAGRFEMLTGDGGLAGRRIFTLVVDSQGRIWAGAENEIAVWDGTKFDDRSPTNSTGSIEPELLIPTKKGRMWVLDGPLLREMRGREWVREVPQWRGLLGAAAGRAMGIHEDRDGGLWFNHYGNGLFHITPDNHFQRLTTGDGLPGERVGAWFQSRDGTIWAGVDHGGLVQLRPREFNVIGPSEGLPMRTALSVCQDTSGAVWIGSAGGGLCCWSGGKMICYPVGTSASANFVFSIFPMASHSVWMSAGEGEELYEFTNGEVIPAAWEVHGIKAILADHRGRLWMGTKAGVAVDANGQRQYLSTNSNGIPLPAVRTLVETPAGDVWAGADNGTIFHCDPAKLTSYRPTDALAEQPIYSMIADEQGTIWAGTFRGGLLRFRNGSFARIGAKQGLPVDVICQLLDDGRGRLWLGTHKGIYSVAVSELNAVADGRANKLNYAVYGRIDGLPSIECSDGYQPACWRGTNGMLWFTTARGVVSVNPADHLVQVPPPPVFIEEVRVDGEEADLNRGKIMVAPGRKQLDFLFTAVSFDAGNLARFRYRVDGLDADWVDIDTRRTVQLRNLPPRNYRFRVIACNREGVWNEAGASIAFEVQPFYYQTWWFKLSAGGLAIGGIILAVRRAATQKYRRKLAQMEKQSAIEHDRARIAKDIHDDIGAGLTQITLLTELARRDPAQTDANLGRISESARKLTKAMDEIVWAVDPQHDTVAGLMDYVSAYAEDYLRLAGVRCRMDLPMELPATPVDAELRYNLFLALKEALNNIVKHAGATEVWLRLRLETRSLTLIVEDNGQGIQTGGVPEDQRLSSGSGLGNLEKRLAEVGGRCQIRSTPGQGTRVELTVFVENLRSPFVAIGRDEYLD